MNKYVVKQYSSCSTENTLHAFENTMLRIEHGGLGVKLDALFKEL